MLVLRLKLDWMEVKTRNLSLFAGLCNWTVEFVVEATDEANVFPNTSRWRVIPKYRIVSETDAGELADDS